MSRTVLIAAAAASWTVVGCQYQSAPDQSTLDRHDSRTGFATAASDDGGRNPDVEVQPEGVEFAEVASYQTEMHGQASTGQASLGQASTGQASMGAEYQYQPSPDQTDPLLPPVVTLGPASDGSKAKQASGKNDENVIDPLDHRDVRPATYFEPLAPIRSFHDWDLRETAVDSLSRIGKAAVPSLIKTLQHPNPNHRVQAARILARIGPDAGQSVNALVTALEDDNEMVRKAAARALGQIGSQASEAVDALMEVILETTPPL